MYGDGLDDEIRITGSATDRKRDEREGWTAGRARRPASLDRRPSALPLSSRGAWAGAGAGAGAGPSGSPRTRESQNPANINFQGEDESACLLSSRNERL